MTSEKWTTPGGVILEKVTLPSGATGWSFSGQPIPDSAGEALRREFRDRLTPVPPPDADKELAEMMLREHGWIRLPDNIAAKGGVCGISLFTAGSEKEATELLYAAFCHIRKQATEIATKVERERCRKIADDVRDRECSKADYIRATLG